MSQLSKKPVPWWVKQDYYDAKYWEERKAKLEAIEAANIPVESKQPLDPLDKLAQDWYSKEEGVLDVRGLTFEHMMRDY